LNISAATLHTAGRSSIRNLRTRHAVVTGTHLSWTVSSILEEMPEYNQPVWWRKGINTNTSITCQETSNLSWGNFEYWEVLNTTAGKISSSSKRSKEHSQCQSIIKLYVVHPEVLCNTVLGY
jgi:hypothetical protein